MSTSIAQLCHHLRSILAVGLTLVICTLTGGVANAQTSAAVEQSFGSQPGLGSHSQFGSLSHILPTQWISDEPTGAVVSEPELVLGDYSSGSGYCNPNSWGEQLMPDGLIYRSYMAGPRESKFQLNTLEETGTGQTLWDVILGGRRGVWRYGSFDTLHPEGWQLDMEGAALVRLNLDNERDVDSSDFRFGVPLTYGSGKWQTKFGYYHLSSHLGDELIVRTPGATRKNYVRDAIIFGLSYNPTPSWRLYGETAYAFFTAGGAEPWEFQFGAEYAKPGVTGRAGTPFFATNGHLRQEIDFGGDYTAQVGWLWRGGSGSQFRTGFNFQTGHSNYYQWYNESEKQFGWAIWYDY
ncbi:DUF1207 domain-containing protein [Aeoliella mucimassa]|uniref:DUF1207 domain-containing protein n=1 Tax=Aeoliella mucimassa TaxID=2527972 RepID=A0A518ATG0_9BACT|nr:DUF1207 domain-containing protein [Aeoliella mucimassa]QDU57977.1 hypothetical protein Pan181_42020 [Aeoliella mucimassa]